MEGTEEEEEAPESASELLGGFHDMMVEFTGLLTATVKSAKETMRPCAKDIESLVASIKDANFATFEPTLRAIDWRSHELGKALVPCSTDEQGAKRPQFDLVGKSLYELVTELNERLVAGPAASPATVADAQDTIDVLRDIKGALFSARPLDPPTRLDQIHAAVVAPLPDNELHALVRSVQGSIQAKERSTLEAMEAMQSTIIKAIADNEKAVQHTRDATSNALGAVEAAVEQLQARMVQLDTKLDQCLARGQSPASDTLDRIAEDVRDLRAAGIPGVDQVVSGVRQLLDGTVGGLPDRQYITDAMAGLPDRQYIDGLVEHMRRGGGHVSREEVQGILRTALSVMEAQSDSR